MPRVSLFVGALSLVVLTWAGLALYGNRTERSAPAGRGGRPTGAARGGSARAHVRSPRHQVETGRRLLGSAQRVPLAGRGPGASAAGQDRAARLAPKGPDLGAAEVGERPAVESDGPDASGLPEPWPPSEAEPVEIPEEPPPETLEVAPGHWVLSAADEERARRDYQRILETQVRLATRYNRHLGRRELCLDEVASEGELARFGFRGGDVLVSIDNQPMESRAQVARYFKEHPGRRTFLLTLRRLGKLVRVRFTAP